MDEVQTLDLPRLEDLITFYPPMDTPDIQTIVTGKREFREFVSDPHQVLEKRGDLYNHQEFFKRLVQPYNHQLIIDEAGTGKSCKILAATEYFRKHKTSITRAYILVKGWAQYNEFFQQLTCRCTAEEEYWTQDVKEARSTSAQRRLLTEKMKQFYTILTYTGFVNRFKHLSDQEIQRRLSGSFIYVDEVHNLRAASDEDTSAINELAQDPAQAGQNILDVQQENEAEVEEAYFNDEYPGFEELPEEAVIPDMTTAPKLAATPAKTGKKTGGQLSVAVIYEQLHRMFHLIQRSKVVLGSATVMFDDVNELPWPLNLILPLDQQMDVERDYSTATIQELEPYFRGRITFVKALQNVTRAVDQGIVLPVSLDLGGEERYPSQSVLYLDVMSNFQSKYYKIAKENTSNFSYDARQAANFVFPDGSFAGKEKEKTGFYKYVKKLAGKRGRGGGGVRYQMTPELRKAIQPREAQPYPDTKPISKYSSKFAAILGSCITEPGSCFVYTEYIVGGAAELLGLCFELFGFERYVSTTAAARSLAEEEEQGLISENQVCLTPSFMAQERRQLNIEKKPRYGILTGKTSPRQYEHLLALFNSPENRHGEYVKVLIGAKFIRDGINLANVVQIHLLGPSWNHSSNYQAIFRGLRTDSHLLLLRELQDQARDRGFTQEEIERVRVIVKIFRHCAAIVLEKKKGKTFLDAPAPMGPERERLLASINQGNVEDIVETSRDIQLYLQAERKELPIRRILTMMKRIAVDCQLNYYRNQYDVQDPADPTAVSEVSLEYSCYSPAPRAIDDSTYNTYFVQQEAERLQWWIGRYFKSNFEGTWASIARVLNENGVSFSQNSLLMALALMVIEHKQITNAYGLASFLVEDRGVFYLTYDYLSVPDLSAVLYQEELSLVDSQALAEEVAGVPVPQPLVFEYNVTHPDGTPKTFQEIYQDPLFQAAVDRLDANFKSQLLEMHIDRYYVQNVHDDALTNAVLQTFASRYFIMFEPVHMIYNTDLSLRERGKGRGRKPIHAKPKKVIYVEDTIPAPLKTPQSQTPSSKTGLRQYYRKKYRLSDKQLAQYIPPGIPDDVLPDIPPDALTESGLVKQVDAKEIPAENQQTHTRDDEPHRLVIIHNVATPPPTNKYDVTYQFSRGGYNIRLLRLGPPESEWRPATEVEALVYNAIIIQQLVNQFEAMAQSTKDYTRDGNVGPFGVIYSLDPVLRIVRFNVSENKSEFKRGDTCDHLYVKDLLDVLYLYNILPEEVERTQVPEDLEDVYRELAGKDVKTLQAIESENPPIEKLRFAAQWLLTVVTPEETKKSKKTKGRKQQRMNREEMCRYLHAFLSDRRLVVRF